MPTTRAIAFLHTVCPYILCMNGFIASKCRLNRLSPVQWKRNGFLVVSLFFWCWTFNVHLLHLLDRQRNFFRNSRHLLTNQIRVSKFHFNFWQRNNSTIIQVQCSHKSGNKLTNKNNLRMRKNKRQTSNAYSLYYTASKYVQIYLSFTCKIKCRLWIARSLALSLPLSLFLYVSLNN